MFLPTDKSDAETRPVAVKNPDKGTCRYGERFSLSWFFCSNNAQMATLSVQEAMGVKVDREAVATLVLPQLWAMSMGPCVYHYSVFGISLT